MMLFFVGILAAGIAALLLVQMADVECVRAPRAAVPSRKLPNFFKSPAKRQEDRTRGVSLAQLAQH